MPGISEGPDRATVGTPGGRSERVRGYYDSDPHREWGRHHGRGRFHAMEWEATNAVLDRTLAPGQSVLDAGCGPGRYAQRLAGLGIAVSGVDLSAGNVALAAELLAGTGATVVRGDLEALPFPDESFDAVLCLGGPLSHVPTPAGRERAASELARVAKPGVPVLVSVMSRWGIVMAYGMSGGGSIEETREASTFRPMWEDGDDDRWGGAGSYAHFFTRDEAVGLLSGAGLSVEGTTALNPFTRHYADNFDALADGDLAVVNWMEMVEATRELPFAADASLHFMVRCRKPGE